MGPDKSFVNKRNKVDIENFAALNFATFCFGLPTFPAPLKPARLRALTNVSSELLIFSCGILFTSHLHHIARVLAHDVCHS